MGDSIRQKREQFRTNQNKSEFDFKFLDFHLFDNDRSDNNRKSIIVDLGFNLDGKDGLHKKEWMKEFLSLDQNPILFDECYELFLRLFKSSILFDEDRKLIWLSYSNGKKIEMKREINSLIQQKILSEEEWFKLWKIFYFGGYPSDNGLMKIIEDILIILGQTTHSFTIPEIAMIPAIRKIGKKDKEDSEINITKSDKKDFDFSGNEIIHRLGYLQGPDVHELHLEKKFEQINEFLRVVTNNKKASLKIPQSEDTIQVTINNKTLPIDSLGTGIHEVIILAAAATVLENQVICMEEPELHLHPLLQKKLIRYLQEHTNNQYFITTHSAHLLDTPNVAIFHVSNENGQSIVESVTSNTNKFSICSDLGYKPSDLLQSNCIIWVEGPSDRIYLNYWIKLFDEIESLQEGIDYTIMFYGGSLISHLSASDIEIDDQIENEEITNFISLLKINRNMVIICDSDKENNGDSLKPSPKRLQDEFQSEKFPGVWITHGREVENYLNPNIVEDAIKKVHSRSNFKSLAGKEIYDFFWKYTTTNSEKEKEADKIKRKKEILKKHPNLDSDAIEKLVLQEEFKKADKVQIAKKIVEQNLDFETIANPDLKEDLKKKIEELIEFIRESNHSESN